MQWSRPASRGCPALPPRPRCAALIEEGRGDCVRHIPYRASSLTRLLQPCLGGHAGVALVATLAPHADGDEGRWTLDFARAMSSVTNPVQAQKVRKWGAQPPPRPSACALST
jgi:hypothetical protein